MDMLSDLWTIILTFLKWDATVTQRFRPTEIPNSHYKKANILIVSHILLVFDLFIDVNRYNMKTTMMKD